MEYLKPNFDLEWNEAERYPEFLKMGKDGWIKKASSDFEIDHYNRIKDVLGNVDLDFNKLDKNKKERFLKSYKRGKIEIPLVVKFSENDYDLIGGNTRLSGLIKQGKNPKLWVIDMTKENIEEKNSEILKGGLADNRSIEDIAKKHKIDIDLLKIQLDNGIEVEMEHTKSKKEAEEIAKDHLWEKPDYYIKLKKIETKESTGADSSGSFV